MKANNKKTFQHNSYTETAEPTGARAVIARQHQAIESDLLAAAGHIEKKELLKAHQSFARVQDWLMQMIIQHSAAHNPRRAEDELQGQLYDLYVFCYERSVECNLYKDAVGARSLIPILSMIRKGWQRDGAHSAKKPASPPAASPPAPQYRLRLVA